MHSETFTHKAALVAETFRLSRGCQFGSRNLGAPGNAGPNSGLRRAVKKSSKDAGEVAAEQCVTVMPENPRTDGRAGREGGKWASQLNNRGALAAKTMQVRPPPAREAGEEEAARAEREARLSIALFRPAFYPAHTVRCARERAGAPPCTSRRRKRTE